MVQGEDFRRYRDNAVYDESRHKFKKSLLTAKAEDRKTHRTGHSWQGQVLQVVQVVQVLQVSYNEALTLKDTKRLTLSLLLLFTPFPSVPSR